MASFGTQACSLLLQSIDHGRLDSLHLFISWIPWSFQPSQKFIDSLLQKVSIFDTRLYEDWEEEEAEARLEAWSNNVAKLFLGSQRVECWLRQECVKHFDNCVLVFINVKLVGKAYITGWVWVIRAMVWLFEVVDCAITKFYYSWEVNIWFSNRLIVESLFSNAGHTQSTLLG